MSKKAVVGGSRLWWKRFVEKVSFEPGMKQWMCDGGWEWWAGGRWIRECDIISRVFSARLAEWDRKLIADNFPHRRRHNAVMWSETVGLREQDRSHTQKIVLVLIGARCGLDLSLGLAGLVLWNTACCAHRHNDLKGHSNFSSTIYIVSLFCAWNITAVINTGIYLLKS